MFAFPVCFGLLFYWCTCLASRFGWSERVFGKFLVRVCVNDLGICDAVTTFFAKKERVYGGRGQFWLGGALRSIYFLFLARRNLLERAHDTSGNIAGFLIQGSSRLWQISVFSSGF